VQLEPLTLPAEQIMISADAPRIRQLIAVLLDNAIRYSHPQGRVSIALEYPPAGDEPERNRVITVRDAGIGISAADLPQVFERNFRSEAARRHRADGTGLGLSIGAALARAHGGEIRIESQPGQGCIARLQLPLIIDPQDIPA
jgi:two-component system, OmpR family, sensor kinase